LKKHRFVGLLERALLLAACTLTLASCARPIYYYPQYEYANRPVPPSGFATRVLAAYTANGSAGGLEILDAYRDLRSNVQDTHQIYLISGFSAAYPEQIFNFPEQQRGYVLNQSTGSLSAVNYSTETATNTIATYGAFPPSVAIAPTGIPLAGVINGSGQLTLATASGTYALTLPNIDKVVINPGASVILAMTRNTNLLYRVVQLSASAATTPPGAIDCEPLNVPIYCIVPVPGTYDRPTDAVFAPDGSAVYVLNSGPEYGGTTASVTVLNYGALNLNTIPTTNPPPNPMLALNGVNPIPVPGGVTAALSSGTVLYVSGQQLQPDGLFAGFLSTINLSTYTVTGQYSISDGHHSKMIFADDNTLWIGSQQCANGERYARGLNYNCLTMVQLGGATPVAQIIPAVTPGGAATVPYPNEDNDEYYYGSLTGICWVQTFHKVYTAYGGQIHAFYTGTYTDPYNGSKGVAGQEIDNTNITVQGNVLDVAYMDAETNDAN
jgi:hypothetical protein